MVYSEEIYSLQTFLELVTQKCYCVYGDDDIHSIQDILKENNKPVKMFPLTQVDQIQSEDEKYVLVDCLVWEEETGQYVNKYMWFLIEDDVAKE